MTLKWIRIAKNPCIGKHISFERGKIFDPTRAQFVWNALSWRYVHVIPCTYTVNMLWEYVHAHSNNQIVIFIVGVFLALSRSHSFILFVFALFEDVNCTPFDTFLPSLWQCHSRAYREFGYRRLHFRCAYSKRYLPNDISQHIQTHTHQMWHIFSEKMCWLVFAELSYFSKAKLIGP